MTDYKYVLYVDEAGDDGIKKVKPIDPNGASEWLVLSGYLIRTEHESSCKEWLDQIAKDINSQSPIIHFRKLSPTKGKRAAELLATHPSRAFIVASNKRSMRGHENERAAQAGGKQWFYNWLVRILLERVTDFCLNDCNNQISSIGKIKVLFSKRGGHSYGQTKAYLELLRTQHEPYLNKRKIDFRFLTYGLIDYVPHYQEAGLQCSDILASAFYRAINGESKIQSSEAAKLLGPIMAKDENGSIRDSGLVLQPSYSRRVSLPPEQAEIFEHFGFSRRETRQDSGLLE